MVLLPGTSQQAGRTLADKLCRHIEETPLVWQGATIRITVSIGLASTTTGQAFDFDQLYRGADTALYQAKDQGRNRVVVQVAVPHPLSTATPPAPHPDLK